MSPQCAWGISSKNLGVLKITYPSYSSVKNSYRAPTFSSEYSTSPNSSNNTIATTSGNKFYEFTTQYYLPTKVNIGASGTTTGSQSVASVQCALMVGNDLYVVSKNSGSTTAIKDLYGRITRYNLPAIKALAGNDKAFLQKNWKSIGVTNPTTPLEVSLATAVQVGPYFKTGHGQSLAYDYKTNEFWMWMDPSTQVKYYTKSTYDVLQRISPATLTPDYQVKFKMRVGNNVVPSGHTLTFDKSGYFYFQAAINNGKYKGGVRIFKGQLYSGGKIKVKVAAQRQVITKAPGAHSQSITYNPYDKRLYLACDAGILSVPASKMHMSGKSTLKSSDIKVSILNTKREMEGVTVGSDKKLYIFCNRHPELFVATTAGKKVSTLKVSKKIEALRY
jgi:hypothetical protein